MDVREKLVELLDVVQQSGYTYTPSQVDDRYGYRKDIPNTKVADHLIANGVVVRERGEWISYDYDIFGYRNVGERCSRCGYETCQVKGGVYYFCGNCGADMRKGENG